MPLQFLIAGGIMMLDMMLSTTTAAKDKTNQQKSSSPQTKQPFTLPYRSPSSNPREEKERRTPPPQQDEESDDYEEEETTPQRGGVHSNILPAPRQGGLRLLGDPKYETLLREGLNIVAKCGWKNECLRLLHTIRVHNTSICINGNRREGNIRRRVSGHTDQQGDVNICPCMLNDGIAENVAYAILHELRHNMLEASGQSTRDLNEEHECDRFANDELEKHGYSHTYVSGY